MPVLAEAITKVPVPQGVQVTIQDGKATVKGPKGELSRTFRSRGVSLRLENNQVVVEKAMPRKKEKAIVGTYAAQIQNMITGVSKGWTYQMKAVFNHFPIKLTAQGQTFLIENFLGERAARTATILPGVKVTVKGPDVTLEGTDIQAVSQTAANIEHATKIRNKDIRVFQDGVYITKKGE